MIMEKITDRRYFGQVMEGKSVDRITEHRLRIGLWRVETVGRIKAGRYCG